MVQNRTKKQQGKGGYGRVKFLLDPGSISDDGPYAIWGDRVGLHRHLRYDISVGRHLSKLQMPHAPLGLGAGGLFLPGLDQLGRGNHLCPEVLDDLWCGVYRPSDSNLLRWLVVPAASAPVVHRARG